MNAAGATTITVNTGIFAAGDTVWLGNIGAGACVVTAGTATVSKFSTASLTLSQYQGAYLYFVSTGVAILYSDSAGASTPLTTKGDLFGYDTANARIPIGTNNQVLTADSAQALGLKWATPAASGGQTSIATGSFSGSTITISSIAGTYRDLKLVLTAFGLSNSSMLLTINGATGVYQEANTFASDSTTGQTNIECVPAFNSLAANMAIINIQEYAKANMKGIFIQFVAQAAVNLTYGGRKFYTSNAAAITSITLSSGSGNFSAGSYVLYGVS
jgi:hypothetical protein